MRAMDWREHATKCREVASTIEDHTARRILMEAAEEYCAMALRESSVACLDIPTYQTAVAPLPSQALAR
jgi:hypothetical protein